MDAWSDEQLKKMQLGGNKRLTDFLAKCGVPKDTAVPEKYNSKGAEVCAGAFAAALSRCPPCCSGMYPKA